LRERIEPQPYPVVEEVIKELCIEPLGLSVTEAAQNRHAGISPEMAVRLSIAFNTTSESLLNQQLQYDLWFIEKERKKLNVKKLVA
jgi:plasmid maintenance system antidote protein VapI